MPYKEEDDFKETKIYNQDLIDDWDKRFKIKHIEPAIEYFKKPDPINYRQLIRDYLFN